MPMLVNIAIGVLIFGYAGWSLVSFIRKSKQGKCASCSANKSCQMACSDISSTPSKQV